MVKELPRGEELLPIAEEDGIFYTPSDIGNWGPVSNALLIKRVEMRIAQGREQAIQHMNQIIQPKDILAHMKVEDALGLEFLKAERKLLEEERRILGKV